MTGEERPRSSLENRQRSQGRVLALQALCVFDALGDDFLPELDAFIRDSRGHVETGLELPVRPDAQRFARVLAEGAWKRRAAYDERLAACVKDWSVGRMSHVDRNILRLGLHELLDTPDTAPQIIINEAVELAHRFGDANSPAFVNGVLDAVRREAGIAVWPTPAAAAERPPRA